MPKINQKKPDDKVIKLDSEPSVAIASVQNELDPEVLEALNAKRVKKTKAVKEVDYIPELERDDSDLDL